MIKTNSRVALRGGQLVVSSRNQPQQTGSRGAASRGRSSQTAALEWGYGSVGGGGNASQFAVANPSMDGMLQGFINSDDPSILRKIFKDIYDNDAICGGTIDLMSMLPFSDFTLTGVDKKLADKYMESIHRLNIKTMLPEITAEYLTYATFCGTLIYQKKSKSFTDLMPHDPEYFSVQDLPFYSPDPIITVRNDKRVRDFMSSEDPEVLRFKRGLSPELLKAMAADEYILDPLTAIYLERRSLMKRGPISLLRRVLPIYFLEKQLFRGTLVETAKRMRGIGHIKIGTERWIPGQDEMTEIMEWFMQADADPLGAMVATREGVDFSEIKPGGEFYGIMDVVDQTSNMKLRALGTSEAFLSGDVSYDNAQVALSVFMDNIQSYREKLTYKMFTSKIFPIIAITNGFLKQQKSETTADLHRRVMYEVNNTQNFDIPQMRWHKQLTADPNNTMLDTLDHLHEAGVPPTLRALCAAGGISLEALLSDIDDEAPIIQMLRDKGYDMSKFLPNSAGNDDGGGAGDGGPPPDGPVDEGGGPPDSDPNNDDHIFDGPGPGGPDNEAVGPGAKDQSSYRAVLSAFNHKFKPASFMRRDFSSIQQEPYALTKTGQKKHIINGNIHNRKLNDTIYKATQDLIANPQLMHSIVQKAKVRQVGGLPVFTPK